MGTTKQSPLTNACSRMRLRRAADAERYNHKLIFQKQLGTNEAVVGTYALYPQYNSCYFVKDSAKLPYSVSYIGIIIAGQNDQTHRVYLISSYAYKSWWSQVCDVQATPEYIVANDGGE